MALIPEHIIERVRESVDIVDVISRYISLKKQGKNYKSSCPFHTEKTPSFTVSSEKQIFYCFGCHAGGNIYNFVMRYEKISFLEAVKFVAEIAGIELPKTERHDQQESNEYDRQYRANQFAANFYNKLLEDNKQLILPYLKQRGILDETVKYFKIGFVPEEWDKLYKEVLNKNMSTDIFIDIGLILHSDKDPSKKYDRFRNRLLFPIQNLSGKVVAFGGRDLSENPNTPKYLNSPESLIYKKSQILYGLFYAKEWIRKEQYAIFVEGYMDYIQLFQNNIKNVVATSGTALTEEQAKLIQRYTSDVVLCYDSDTAGIKAAMRGGQILFQNNINTKILILPENNDPDNYVKHHGASAFYALLDSAEDYFQFKIKKSLQTMKNSDIGHKTTQMNELIELLALQPNPIKRNFYLKTLAQQVELDEDLLAAELVKKRTVFNQRKKHEKIKEEDRKINDHKITLFTGAWSAEKDLLNLLLSNLENVNELVFKYIEPEDLQNEEYRNIFLKIKEIHEKSSEEVLHHILSNVENEQIIGLLTAELFEEINNPVKYLQDCIEKIKLARYNREMEELRIQLSHISNSDPEYSVLLNRINNILIKKQTINKIFTSS